MAFKLGLAIAFFAVFAVAILSGVYFLASGGDVKIDPTSTARVPPSTTSTVHIFPPPPTVIVERPTPLPGTATPLGRIPEGTPVNVRPSLTSDSVLLIYTYETAQSLETMDRSTRDILVRTWVLSGAACAVTPTDRSKARVLAYRGDYVQVMVTEGACNRTTGWTRAENIALQ